MKSVYADFFHSRPFADNMRVSLIVGILFAHNATASIVPGEKTSERSNIGQPGVGCREDEDRRTGLMLAVDAGELAQVEACIGQNNSAGYINALDDRGWTALTQALLREDRPEFPIVDALIGAGADVNDALQKIFSHSRWIHLSCELISLLRAARPITLR